MNDLDSRTEVSENKAAVRSIILASAAISIFLVWFIYFKAPATSNRAIIAYLPALNATLNALSGVCLVFGYLSIRSRNREAHKRFMISALVLSALFLVSYLTYHHFQGDTRFLATGMIRPIYFFILISHIILSVAVLPMVLITVFHALRGRFSNHKKIARYTFPVWLYVSVTGVLVFLMLNVFNHAP